MGREGKRGGSFPPEDLFFLPLPLQCITDRTLPSSPSVSLARTASCPTRSHTHFQRLRDAHAHVHMRREKSQDEVAVLRASIILSTLKRETL